MDVNAKIRRLTRFRKDLERLILELGGKGKPGLPAEAVPENIYSDLVIALNTLSQQIELLRANQSFQNTIDMADDLRQMLCNTMNWLMEHIGYTNAAIFLPCDGSFQLAAYLKCTIHGTPELTGAIIRDLLPAIMETGLFHLPADKTNQLLTADDIKPLRDNNILGGCCFYIGEPLACIVLFRDNAEFTEDHIAKIKSILSIFNFKLASMSHDCGSSSESPEEDPDDPDNWWRRGEEPPF